MRIKKIHNIKDVYFVYLFIAFIKNTRLRPQSVYMEFEGKNIVKNNSQKSS